MLYRFDIDTLELYRYLGIIVYDVSHEADLDLNGLSLSSRVWMAIHMIDNHQWSLSNFFLISNKASVMSCFIGGLRTNICHIVQMFKPITLAATIGLARLRYDELAANRPNYRPLSSQLLPPPTAAHPLTTSKTLTRSRPTAMPIKWLTPVEMKVRHNKVLCYKCLAVQAKTSL